MLLIETSNSFVDYIKSLSAHARADWAYVRKHNRDLTYECVDFDRGLVESFMQLWEQQLVRDKPIAWAFPIGYVEELAAKGELLLFVAKNEQPMAAHFIQKRSGYWECHPPMYDKKYKNRSLAKFMWFNLIRYGIQNQLGPLNMGGGIDDWREMIRRREEFPNPAYKWIYVPEEVKDNPDSQPNYYIENHALHLRKND